MRFPASFSRVNRAVRNSFRLPKRSWEETIPKILTDKYDFYNFNHAVEILSQAYPEEWEELARALDTFSLSTSELTAGGGNESAIPKHFSSVLRPSGWEEVRITGNLVVRQHRRNSAAVTETVIKDFIDGHNIDYVKGEVAVDLEWNSKDQTFDRDLYAFRTFYECGIVKCGAIITRSEKLNPVFTALGIKHKYGASTTWMGKLLPRIHAGRHGGCPILVIGITPNTIADWGN